MYDLRDETERSRGATVITHGQLYRRCKRTDLVVKFGRILFLAGTMRDDHGSNLWRQLSPRASVQNHWAMPQRKIGILGEELMQLIFSFIVLLHVALN